MQTAARQVAAEGKTIAIVPTMGYLHEGHLSLVRKAARKADVVITTIFVNPAQFAATEDLSRYPRDEKADIDKIKKTLGAASKDAFVFIPPADEIYPDDFQTWVTVEKLTRTLEGAKRPTHFRGVTTIVAKLFNITRPDVALFGMKDFQQAVVLKQMTSDLGYPIKFIVAPTVRERDGLAMSSRNAYLSEIGRWEAVCLYYALGTAKEMVKSGIKDIKVITREMRAVIKAACAISKIDYIAFTEMDTLAPVKAITKGTVCSLAVDVHGVRMIDNMKLA